MHTVTTNRAAHDYAAGTVDFFGPGSPAFPETNNHFDKWIISFSTCVSTSAVH